MRYKVITLDPPWPYDRTSGQGVANKQYDLMTWDDLYALGPLVKAVAAPDCAIFMWTTAPLLIETVDMVKAWRLRYVTKAFSWVKTYASGGIFFGIGSYTASNTEDVWLLSNGTPKRKAKDVSQVVPTLIKQDAMVAPMSDHSAKPEEMQDRIERLLCGPYLEIFARRRRPGWTCIGNELDGLDIRESLARLAHDAPLPIVNAPATQQATMELEAA